MRRVSAEIIELIKSGQSLNRISKKTGLRKSTLYYHYKKLNGKKTKEIILNFRTPDQLGEFLGIFAGDGYFQFRKEYHYTISIAVGAYEEGYYRALQQKFSEWFQKQPMEYTSYYRGKPSCIQLTYYSRAIYDLICKYLVWEGKKSYSIRLRKLDIHKKEFNLGFLRGLIDTDGNFYAPRKRISFSTVSKSLMDQVMLIVRHNCNLNLTYYVYQKKGRAPLHTIALSGANAKKLIDLVRPRNPSKHGSGVAW